MDLNAEELFVRKYDELHIGLIEAKDDYDVVKLTAVLRQLLLDSYPLIHAANRNHNIAHKFLVNRTIVGSDLPDKPDILFHADSINPATFKSAKGTELLNLDKFLNLTIIELINQRITIKDIINFTANKIGIIHYDEGLDGKEKEIQNTFKKINELGISGQASAIKSIGLVVIQTLAPLRDAIMKLPSTIPLIAHYKNFKGGYKYFTGNDCLETNNFNASIDNGFSWSGLLRIIRQPTTGNRIIYETGSISKKIPKFTILIDKDGSLCCKAHLNSSSALNAKIDKFTKSQYFNEYFFLICQICIKQDDAELSIYINNELICRQITKNKNIKSLFERQVLGANLKSRQSAAFYAREIVISSRCLTKGERQSLEKYFWLQWKE